MQSTQVPAVPVLSLNSTLLRVADAEVGSGDDDAKNGGIMKFRPLFPPIVDRSRMESFVGSAERRRVGVLRLNMRPILLRREGPWESSICTELERKRSGDDTAPCNGGRSRTESHMTIKVFSSAVCAHNNSCMNDKGRGRKQCLSPTHQMSRNILLIVQDKYAFINNLCALHVGAQHPVLRGQH